LSFTPDEKKRATGVTYNISTTNHIAGSVGILDYGRCGDHPGNRSGGPGLDCCCDGSGQIRNPSRIARRFLMFEDDGMDDFDQHIMKQLYDHFSVAAAPSLTSDEIVKLFVVGDGSCRVAATSGANNLYRHQRVKIYAKRIASRVPIRVRRASSNRSNKVQPEWRYPHPDKSPRVRQDGVGLRTALSTGGSERKPAGYQEVNEHS